MRKVVLVTGGSSGIGKAICTVLAAKGYKVYGTSRNPENQNQKDKFSLLKMDVGDSNSIKLCVQELLDKEGKIDILVNNAGIGIMSAVEDVSDEEFNKVMDTNVLGPTRVLREVLPVMRAQKSGLVINVASIAGHISLPYRGVYCASKAALQKITESLRMELKPYNVHACVLDPGDFATSISQNRVVAQRVTEQVSPYTSDTLRVEAAVNKEVGGSSDPKIVGNLVHRIAQSKKVKVYYSAGKFMQKFAVVVKRLLPALFFEGIIEKKYGMK